MSDELDRESDEVEELREQLRAERRVAELSRTLLSLDLDESEDWIHDALGCAARGAGADRAQLVWMRRDGDRGLVLDRYVWAASGVEPIQTDDDEQVIHGFPWLRSRLQAGEVVHIPRVEDLPDEAAAERESLLDHDNRSYLAIPLLSLDLLTGLLDVRCVRRPRTWSPEEIEGIRLIGEVLCSVMQRKDANAAQRESADRFRAMAENLHITLTESTPDGRLLYASPRMPELLGYSNAAFQKLGFDELVHPDDLEESRQIYETGDRDGDGTGGVFRARHRDGSWRYIEAQGRSYEIRSGERRFVTLLRDVSERHERNAELKLRLELETLISNLSRRFLSSEPAGIDDVIRGGLQSVAQVGGADRAFLVSLPELRRDEPYFFEWCSVEVPSRDSSPTEADALQYGGFSSRLLAGEVVSIPVVADMPDEQATEREAMLRAGIRSCLLLPAA